MKRFFAIVMMITLLAGLSGCGVDSYEIGTSMAGVTNSSENKEIEVWCWDMGFNGYAIEQAAKMYEEMNDEVTVNLVEVSWWEIQERVERAILTGQVENLPEIILMQDMTMTKHLQTYTEMFADLTDSGINFKDFASFKTGLSTYNGKNYGLPFDSGAAVACYRTDILKESGYSIDDLTDITWARFLEIGKDVLAKTGKPLLTNQIGSSELIMLMVESAGGSLFDANGAIHIADNEILKEVIEIYQELIQAGVLVEVSDWNGYIESIEGSNVAGAMNGSWITGTVSAYEAQSGLWEVTNIPRLNRAATATNYSNQGGATWFVMNYAENKDAAIDFLANTLGNSTDLYNELLQGAGIVGTYLPAASSSAYTEPQTFFGGQKVYQMITTFSGNVPEVCLGRYNSEARGEVGFAVTEVIGGKSISKALKDAQVSYAELVAE